MIELLCAEHHVFLEMIDTIQEAMNRETCRVCRLQAMTEVLGETLQAHAKIEGDFLFPALERHLDPDGPTDALRRDHELMEAEMTDILSMPGGNDERTRQEVVRLLVHFLGVLRGHIDKEETILFPMVRRILMDETLEILGAKAFVARHGWRRQRHPEPDPERR